jgi:hypothetical protein
MEDVLEAYKRPFDKAVPVVCMDEKPQQLLGESRRPIPGKGRRPHRIDHEYIR